MKCCTRIAASDSTCWALLRGVSTREYQEVLPQMAQTVGVSRSAISRKAVEASAEQLQQLRPTCAIKESFKCPRPPARGYTPKPHKLYISSYL